MPPDHKARLIALNTGSRRSPETCAKISNALTGRKNPHPGYPVSDETRSKMSKALKGKKRTPETCINMSNAQKGRVHKPSSPETRAKISAANIGRPKSAEARANMSGKNNHNYGKPCSPETRAKLSVANTGRHHTPETKAKISATSTGKRTGQDAPGWKGGISFEPYCPKFNRDLRRRIRAFFDHECVLCGKPQSTEYRSLSCHHVNYSKSACCDGKPVHFAALCRSCHGKTNGDREQWAAILHRTIEEIWQGRSYYTKDEWREAQCKN